MLNNLHINIIKSTIPLLESAGPALTQHFYQRMFTHNPELKDIFNMTHQRTGRQGVALFEAIAAYAKNIDNLAALTTAVERIAQKHTSFNIQPDHYQIVGHHLIETLRELATAAFTSEVEEAWTEAYLFLAKVFIDREADLYLQRKHAVGGWEAARTFVIADKIEESALVTSFILQPKDGGDVLDYTPGQYIGIEVHPEGAEYKEMRQYSLSDKPNGKYYRISVKREGHGQETQGVVSNHLHDDASIGQEVNLYAPAGDFMYQERNKPVTLISAGVGVTPMQSMLEFLSGEQKNEPVLYLHACEDVGQHSFTTRVKDIVADKGWEAKTWYMNKGTLECENTYEGPMDLAPLSNTQSFLESDFYICGPVGFMKYIVEQLDALKVDRSRVHYEVFGPHADF
ncbi:NO-inducible flavohemoprotein [Vibrio sp. SNU_ST1]|uniref:NO-inducible flavohemoprotein n=1 Tax=Vibrio sp. SNU_ST1 TaxID=3064001 RepID=UPI00272D95D1|nr:NO-inducible flavohemoprotein [Vibrio sp. SNU_ST1]WKY60543.1 NO-inducible flavohemoprotein [Vibrio sp. SNU_ST1]